MNIWTDKLSNPHFSLDIITNPNDLKAQDIMHYGVFSVHRYDPVAKAASILIEKDISGLPVLSQQCLEGMLTDKDLLKTLHETQYLPGVVEDYMTPSAYHFNVEDRIIDICNYLSEKPFRRVPVLHEGRLAGMITRGDLINAYKEQYRPQTRPLNQNNQDPFCAENIMRQGLITVHPETHIYDAMQKLVQFHITGLPVINRNGSLLGIITEKDLLHHICKSRIMETEVGALMTQDVISLPPQSTFDEVCQCLLDHAFHTVPIVEEGRLVGLINRSDVLKSRLAVFRP